MTRFFNEAKFSATAACSLLISALLIDGATLCWHMASNALSIMTAYNAYASISILACACFVAFASRSFDVRNRRKILELRMPIAWALGIAVTIVHVCAILLPSFYQLSSPVNLLAEAFVPPALFVPLIAEACFASLLAWGATDLRLALCFPLAFLGTILLTDVYGIDRLIVSLVCVIIASALLIRSARPAVDTFCVRMSPQSLLLGCLGGSCRLSRQVCLIGVSAMAVFLSLSISTFEFGPSAEIAVLLLLVLVYFYQGERKVKVFGILVLLVVILFMWLHGFEHRRAYFMLLVAMCAAFAHMEMGPRGLCLILAVLLGGLGICNAVHCSDRYYDLMLVSNITISLLVPLSFSLLAFSRPDSRVLIAWLIPRKSARMLSEE